MLCFTGTWNHLFSFNYYYCCYYQSSTPSRSHFWFNRELPSILATARTTWLTCPPLPPHSAGTVIHRSGYFAGTANVRGKLKCSEKTLPLVHISTHKSHVHCPGSSKYYINPLKPELNPICYLLALLGAHNFHHVSRRRVKLLTLRWLMSYIYGAPILDVSRSHTTTQHSR